MDENETRLTWEKLNTFKLHELLALALSDLERCEASPNCRIEMNSFLDQDDEGNCNVCLAGSVLLVSMGYHTLREWSISVPLPERNKAARKWMYAIDYLRAGRVFKATIEMGIWPRREDLDRRVTDYHKDRGMWHADMQLLLQDLQKANI